MSKEKRDKRRKKKKWIRAMFISFILIYLIFRSVPALYASNLKTVLVEEGTIEDSVNFPGIIVRNERVYRADGDGKINFLKKEGERVKVGAKIAELSLVEEDSSLESELKEVNKKIESIEKVNKQKEMAKKDETKSEKNTEMVIEELQDNIINGDYDETTQLKEELYCSLGKKSNATGENTLANQSLDNLKNKKEELTKEILNSTINYFSKEAGIVSFKIDGFEEIYNGNNILNYTLEDIRDKEAESKVSKNKSDVNAGDAMFKVMDNYDWYLLVDVDDIKKIKSLKERDMISICLDDSDEELRGRIIKIKSKNGQGIVAIKLDTHFHDYCEKRNVDIEIIKSKNEGLKVPTKAICEKDGLNGVYIKDISGIIRFRPVKILGQNEEYTIVSKGNNSNFIDIEGSDKRIKTIKVFDEILLSGGKAKEGQIID
ncbi:HlyD family efflux transporter periplasmic adaptor subunit [Sporanaerobacter acetigenes]|uniref:Putative membrane fusion protein n=1 Tax=Sporanaerobacter acetigenes DSM 13106 TaxID=1123281 RepID=A0A1M5XVS6_9FIRM|nr:HlyD family efflux transporter periplasmic adaptor subunit [Sporanaerobacter acetigenes]SHI03856.1 putative membrane fusion protein [Sporanaerobacter acetigenes DSM 13106]